MANGNDLAQAYSILGQATSSEYRRRREEEERREKRLMRQQLLGYLAQPLLKSAGEAIGEGVTTLIKSPFERKYDDFLQSEQFRIAQSKQTSAFNTAQGIISEDDKAVLDPQGREYYYTNKKYARILEEFNRTYPEEEYKEGVNGILWQQAQDWTKQNLSKIDAQVNAARKVRSPEDTKAVYRENVRPRTLGEFFSDGVNRMFGKKTLAQTREDRLNYLAESSNTNRTALLDAKRALGPDAPIRDIAGLAQKIDNFRVDQEAFTQVSSEEVFPKFTVNGKTFQKRLLKVELQNKLGQTIKQYRHLDGTKITPEEAIQLGTYTEKKTKKDAVGREIEYEVTYTVTSDGFQNAVETMPTVGPMSPTLAAAQASEGELRQALNASERVSRSLKLQDGSTPKQSNIFKIYMEGPELQKMEPNQLQSVLQDQVQGYAATLRTLEGLEGLDPDTAYPLAAAMLYRNLDSLVTEKAVTPTATFGGKPVIGGVVDEFEDFNLEQSNGLSPDMAQKAGGIYALDAFYSLEGTPAAVTISRQQESMLQELAINQFQMLSKQHQERMLSILSQYDPLNKKEYGADKEFSFMDKLGMSYREGL